MGAPRQFPLEYDAVYEAIEQYKEKVAQGIIEKPSIPNFLGTIGASTEDYMDVIYDPVNKNIPLSKLLKNFGAWMEGEIVARYPAPLAKFLLCQGFGGYRYTDKQEVDTNVKAEIEVKFNGVTDAFG